MVGRHFEEAQKSLPRVRYLSRLRLQHRPYIYQDLEILYLTPRSCRFAGSHRSYLSHPVWPGSSVPKRRPEPRFHFVIERMPQDDPGSYWCLKPFCLKMQIPFCQSKTYLLSNTKKRLRRESFLFILIAEIKKGNRDISAQETDKKEKRNSGDRERIFNKV
jgi:hypothetical protein